MENQKPEKRITSEQVQKLLPSVRTYLDDAVKRMVAANYPEWGDWGSSNADVPPEFHAAWQIALIEKAAELAKRTFKTSQAHFARAAYELYDDG
jgi:hypothetical protein